MTTDHLAGDPAPEEATGASADRAAPAAQSAPAPAPSAPERPTGAPGPDRDGAPAPDDASAAPRPGGEPQGHPAEPAPPAAAADSPQPGEPGQPDPASPTPEAEPDAPEPDAQGETGAGAEPTETSTDAPEHPAPADASGQTSAAAGTPATESATAEPGQPGAASAAPEAEPSAPTPGTEAPAEAGAGSPDAPASAAAPQHPKQPGTSGDTTTEQTAPGTGTPAAESSAAAPGQPGTASAAPEAEPSAPTPGTDAPAEAGAGSPDAPTSAAAPRHPEQPGTNGDTVPQTASEAGTPAAGSAAAKSGQPGVDARDGSAFTSPPGHPATAEALGRAGGAHVQGGPVAQDAGEPGAGSGAAPAAGADAGRASAGSGGRSAAAEALAAAVRAVESGERSAASFFNEPRPAPAKPREPARTAAAAPIAPPARPAAAGVAGVREVLAAGGAPEALAVPVAETLGERAAEALREDPWQLLAVPGVRPDQADGFARALLGPDCGPGDERRSQALTGWLLERAALEGHTALESSALRAALAKVSVPDPDEALQAAIAGGGVLVFQDALETPPGAQRPAPAAPDDDEEEPEQPVRVLLGLDRYALAEESLADGFARLITTFADVHTPAPDWEAAATAAPSPSAAELIRTVAAHGLVTHSGGEAARAEPAALVVAARSSGLRVCAAAHSEDGRRRLAGEVGADAAVTVAGLLSGGEGPGRDEDGALALDLIAVLDAPQLDVETAAMLVESLPDGARLVLSGDPGVLWSAGPGRVFADLVAARRCPQVVSRTPDPGPIGELVSGIGIGELNQVEAPGKEVVIVPARDAGEAVHRTVQLVADSVPRAIGVPPEQTQVITPGHGGAAGTRALNTALKERLNPGPGRFAGFDPGDRVAYTPAPGRAVPGTVVSADAEGLRLDCAGAPVVVPREQVGDLVRHGWALTAHQAAGTRWPAAVVVLPGDAAAGLTRAWIYTAFSRGERHLSVVHGADAALPRAVAEIPFKDRTTRLRSLLQTQAPPTG